jgi:hypothetical protein
LELGEQLLARHPGDAATHLDMGEAAEALGLSVLAVWLLEQGREQVPDSVDLMRGLARAYEQVRELGKAMRLWEMVRKLDPQDNEAQQKINALSVREHLSKGRYLRA